ncbi:hypothetical protein RM407_004403 [Enterobacter kobei]|nr:hypothetical protein [Enterobacter kobei]
MNHRYKIILCIFLVLSSARVFAVANFVFEARSVSSFYSAGSRILQYSVSNPDEEVPCPKVSNDPSQSYVFIYPIYGLDNEPGNINNGSVVVDVPGCPKDTKTTVGNIVNAILNEYGGINVWHKSTDEPFAHFSDDYKLCVGQYSNAGIEPMPSFSCRTGVYNPVVCSVSDNIQLDHGTLSSSELNNHSVTRAVEVNCSGETTASMTISSADDLSKDTISLGEGVESSFLINGNALQETTGAKVNFVSGINTLNITSVLSSSGKVSAGVHSGQGVLLISPH